MLFFRFEILVELNELVEGGGGPSQVGRDGLGGAVLDRDEFGECSRGFGEGDGFGGGDGAGDRFHLWEGERERVLEFLGFLSFFPIHMFVRVLDGCLNFTAMEWVRIHAVAGIRPTL